MPEETKKPVGPAAAKVAKAKKPAKKTVEAAKLAKAVEAKTSPSKDQSKAAATPAVKRSNIKLPYNLRTRSVVRTIVLAIEDEVQRKAVNAALRDLRKYSEIRDWAEANIGKAEFQEVLEGWFAAGTLKD